MLPSLVSLNEVLWFLLSLHCRLADNSQPGLRSLVGKATIIILFEQSPHGSRHRPSKEQD